VTTADQCEVQAFLAAQGFSQPGASRRKLTGGGRHEVCLVEEGERKAVLKLHAPPRGTGTLDSFEHELRCHRFLAAHLPEHVPALLGAGMIVRESSGGKDAGSIIETAGAHALRQGRQSREGGFRLMAEEISHGLRPHPAALPGSRHSYTRGGKGPGR
jgi:hypothetical protein